MEKFKEIRVSIPVELYDKFKKYLKKEYSRPTEFVRRQVIEYVMDKEEE
jgi:metal-responsive CopG/Arc/MetJ family transcriptional regulator